MEAFPVYVYTTHMYMNDMNELEKMELDEVGVYRGNMFLFVSTRRQSKAEES